jgi:hypothetical protein
MNPETTILAIGIITLAFIIGFAFFGKYDHKE